MGSGHSSSSNSGSFSIDPSGNISPTKKMPQQDSDSNKNQYEKETNNQSETNSGVESSIEDNYIPSTIELPGKNSNVFEEVEANLMHCYKTNKDQPLNCLKLSHEYNDYVRQQRSQSLERSLRAPLITTILMILACMILRLDTVQCYGAMSVDLGSEWMKVGLIAPSVQMDIVLNPQSQRKTAMAIAFTNGERYIGDSALDVASKYPERTFTHFLDLVGKTIQDGPVKHYKQRFPYADIVSHEPNSTSIVLNHPQGLKFTPLELIAMMLQHAHDQVVTRLNSNEPANDVVITVPPFFNEVEKKVIKDAAKLAGLNVLRLTNVNSAFALSYGIFRHKDYQPESSGNKTSILFFDQGASHTSVTLADYCLVEQVDESTGMSKNESLPTITIRAQVYDRYLGGFDMQLRLRDYLVKEFVKKTKIDESRIYKRGRSAAKLLKESGRVKRVLSANTDHLVRIENVIDDQDLKQLITRQEFEQMNEDLLTTRIISLLDRLFELPDVSRDDRFESVIIVGGNTRTPKIQQVLLDYFKLDTLGKSINADEGAALATLYQAASLGRGFRVKKFVLEEFGEERKRFDPSKVVTTTTTPEPPAETSTAEPASTDENKSVTTETIESAEVSTSLGPNSIYSESELKRISEKLSYLRRQDFLRNQRLTLRNSLESLLSDGKEKLSNDEENIKEKRDEIRKIIADTYEWLENGPNEERDNVTLLADKYTLIYDLINPRPPTTVPPPPPPPPPSDFDPSSIDLSSVLNNDTLSILDALNLTNPFGQLNDTDPVAANESRKQENISRVIPETVEPGPPHTEL